MDILCVEACPTDRSDPLSGRWEALKARFDGQKLIALTEFGGVPDIETMHQFGVWFSCLAPWSGAYGPTSMPTSTVVRIYRSGKTFTLNELNAIPLIIAEVTRLPRNEMRLSGHGRRGANYTLMTSTNAMLPPNHWTSASTGKLSGGVFITTNTINPTLPARFQRLELLP